MPNYDVFYCMIKPVTIIAGRGLTGAALTASPTRPTDTVLRGEILLQLWELPFFTKLVLI